MKVTYFVNTMVLLEGARSRVLCDPWVTFGMKSVSDFYNFPEAGITREGVAAIAPDFIYLTHSHPDHFDPVTLDLFDRATPVLIAKFANPFFERAIRRLGYTDVRIADPVEGTALNGEDRCWIWPARTYPDVDSIALMKIDGSTVIDANDNPFHAAQCEEIRARFGPVDVALLPFAAHGPYPMFYDNLSAAEKAAKAAEREKRAYDSLARYSAALGARNVIPFAAGLIAGGDKALRYEHSGIGTRTKAVEHARGKTDFHPILLSEGCSYDFADGTQHGRYVEKTFETERGYVERVARQPNRFDAGGRFHVAPSEQIDLSPYLAMAREKQRKWQEIKSIASEAVYFLDTGQGPLYRLTLGSPEVSRVREEDITDAKFEIFRLPYGLLLGLLTRHYNWSNMKSQYVAYFRRPDVFDAQLHLAMSFLHL